MALTGLQIINVGLPNELAGSDSLYTAFNKLNDNFNVIATNASPYNSYIGNTGISTTATSSNGTVVLTNTGVISISAGTGIYVNQANGAVTISTTLAASGFSGYSGYSGVGLSGYSGINGIIGADGASGYSGIDGVVGESGYSGYSGAAGGGGDIGGSNTYVQYNDAGVLGGNAGFTYDSVNNAVGLSNIVSTSNVSIKTTSSFQAWIAQYGDLGVNTQDDYSSAVNYDSGGNVYSVGADGNTGIPFVVKYNSGGTIVWQKTFTESNNYYKTGDAIAVDYSGNIYVGMASSDAVEISYLVKLDSAGDIIWQRELDTISNTDAIMDMGVDSNNNVYLLGVFYDSNYRTAVLKFNASGTLQWQRTLTPADSSGDYPQGLAVDPGGNCFVATSQGTYPNIDTVLVKYNTGGAIQWQQAFTGGGGYTSPGPVAIDSTGDIYMAVYQSLSTPFILQLIKTDSAGTLIWQRGFEMSGTIGGVALDDDDNVYVGGYFYNGATTLNDYFIIKYDPAGTMLWQRSLSGAGNDYQYYYWATHNLDVYGGTFVLSGYSYSPNLSNAEAFFVQLPIDGSGTGTYGDFTYAVSTTGEETTPALQAAGTMVDAAGSLSNDVGTLDINVGTSTNTLTSIILDNYWYFNTNGESEFPGSVGLTNIHSDTTVTTTVGVANKLAWYSEYQSSVNLQDVFGGTIAVDSTGNIYVLTINVTPRSTYLIKYNNLGELIWEKTLTDASIWDGRAITIDSTDQIIVCLFSVAAGAPFNYPAAVVMKLDQTGVIQWENKIVYTNIEHNFKSVATDSSNNVYIAGGLSTSFAAIMKYNSAGTLQWQRKLGESAAAVSLSLDVTASGDSYVAIMWWDGVDNRPALAKYDTSGSLLWQKEYTGDSLWPIVKLDSAGNSHLVCRNSAGIAILIKSDGAGDIIWQRSITISGNVLQLGGIAVDQVTGDVYLALLTAANFGVTGYDWDIIKFDSTGTLIWNRRFGGTGYESFDTSAGTNGLELNGTSFVLTGGAQPAPFTDPWHAITINFPKDGSFTGTYGNFTYSSPVITVGTSTVVASAGSLVDAAGTLTVSTALLASSAVTNVNTSTLINIGAIDTLTVEQTGIVVLGNVTSDSYYYGNGAYLTGLPGSDPGGANTYVQYNDAGAFGANANLTFDKTTGLLTTYNVTAGNLVTTSDITTIDDLTVTIPGTMTYPSFINHVGVPYDGEYTIATAVAYDSSNNIFMLGFNSYGVVNFLQKYNNAGESQWIKEFAKTGDQFQPAGLNISASGNIYISFINSTSTSSTTVLKLDSSGSILWQKRLDPPAASGYTTIFGMGVDSSENVYTLLDDDTFVKLNSSGVIQWQYELAAPAGTAIPIHCATDASGNSVLLYYWENGGVYYTVVLKLDTSGIILWQNSYTYGVDYFGYDFGRICILAGTGDIYFTTQANGEDAVITKLNSSGVLQWARILTPDLVNQYLFRPFGIAVDSTGAVYIGGEVELNTRGLFAVKYNSAGTLQWQRQLYDPTWSGYIRVWNNWHDNLLAVNNNQYIIGGRSYSVGFVESIFYSDTALVAQFPSDGTPIGVYGGFGYAAMTSTSGTYALTTATTAFTRPSGTVVVSNDGYTQPTPTLSSNMTSISTGRVIFSETGNVIIGDSWSLPKSGGTEDQVLTLGWGGQALWANTVATSNVQTWTAHQTFYGGTTEYYVKDITTISSNSISANSYVDFDITDQKIIYYTANASTNWGVNFTSANSYMSIGETIHPIVMNTIGANAYVNKDIYVDGAQVNPYWLTVRPTSGNANSIDIYKYDITKTANSTFTVLASQFKYTPTPAWTYWLEMSPFISYVSCAGTDVSIDGSGNSYHVGQTSNFSIPMISKIDSSGTLLWQYQISTGATAFYGTAIDSTGSIYIAGSGGLMKINSSGTILWQRLLISSVAIAIDSSDNIYVVGSNYVVKYDTSGTVTWQIQISGTTSLSGVSVDSSGNIFVTGTTTSGSVRGFLAKLNSSGAIQFQQVLTSTSSLSKLKVAASGNMYTVGFNNAASTPKSGLLIKHNSAGAIVWAKDFYYISPTTRVTITGVDVDASENVYVSGYWYLGSSTGYWSYYAKFDSSGTLLWNNVITPPAAATNSIILLNSIKYTATNTALYMTGYSRATGGGNNLTAYKMPADGTGRDSYIMSIGYKNTTGIGNASSVTVASSAIALTAAGTSASAGVLTPTTPTLVFTDITSTITSYRTQVLPVNN